MIEYCLNKAKTLSKTTHKVRVYAVIYDKKGKVLGEGANSYTKTSPYQARLAQKVGKDKCEFLHAEIHAFSKLRRIKGTSIPHTIVVCRVDKQNFPVNSKPCPICNQAAKEHKIKKIIHT